MAFLKVLVSECGILQGYLTILDHCGAGVGLVEGPDLKNFVPLSLTPTGWPAHESSIAFLT